MNPIRNIYFKSLDKISNGVKKVREGKEAFKILVKVRPRVPVTRNQRTETRGLRRRRGVSEYPGIPEKSLRSYGAGRVSGRKTGQGLRLNTKELREFEADLDKRLTKMKYWASYLTNLNQGKHRNTGRNG